eukprot:3899619-Alexandrium_andersonii.AAC.1
MSASLVGSEMCIRDRFSTSQTSARVGTGASIMLSTICVAVITKRPAACACLLYTSDAADDM